MVNDRWYYNAERPHSTHGMLTPDEVHANQTEPTRMAARDETLIHLNLAAIWSKKLDHLCVTVADLVESDFFTQ
jgi:hypothetical protein